MNVHELIGLVGAAYLKRGFSEKSDAGVARFFLDHLSEDECIGIVKAVRKDRDLSKKFLIKLPKTVFRKSGVPEELLTDERATYFRNFDVKKPGLLLAFIGDDEGQSLRELTPVGAEDLRQEFDLWVSIAGKGLRLTENHRTWWIQALKGLTRAQPVQLESLAHYVLETRTAVQSEGLAVLDALGYALPTLRIPRDASYFRSIPARKRGQYHRWKKPFQKAIQDRACYLKKRNPAGQIISSDSLRENWEKVKDQVRVDHHDAIERFIDDDPGWNDSAAALAERDYEEIKQLFDGLRRKTRPKLGEKTLEYYDENLPETLTEDEKDVLERLDSRTASEGNEDDRDFYEAHRVELKGSKQLKRQWENYIYGSPLECSDFLVGFLEVLERLFERSTGVSGERRLHIEAKYTKRETVDINQDAAMYFATRYSGLDKLFGERVTWDLGELLNYPELARMERYRDDLNDSVAKDAIQIHFTFRLRCTKGQGQEDEFWQSLIWKFDHKSVLSEFRSDLDRLAEHPLLLSRVSREKVNPKGRLQFLDLGDKTTFLAVYEKDRGSFVGSYDPDRDLSAIWPRALKQAVEEGRVTRGGGETLKKAWEAFEKSYSDAITGLVSPRVGISCAGLIDQAEAYRALLEAILGDGRGDRNRGDLLEPLLRVGSIYVDGGRPSCVLTPWHPMRLAGIAIKARQLAGLVRHLMTESEVNFGDPKFFFTEWIRDLQHPYYPQVTPGFEGKTPVLLGVSDTVGDYSLLESPIRGKAGYDEANENPSEAAGRIVGLVKRYVELQPHEKANLSLVLYNCDSARLPEATVEAIGDLYEEEENVRCETHLRHSDQGKLRELYEKMVEASDHNPDSFVVTEATRDFIAGLRVNIMADVEVGEPSALEGTSTDLVFLQDVVARHAELRWESEPGAPIDLETHVPARWSRRRPAAKDDQRSVVYLTCPVQPPVGWTYLAAVRSLVGAVDADPKEDRMLPARMVSFQNNEIDHAFKEVHKLGQWVVNYDEILDRRQLRNQGVRIIRYQQSATQGRNLIVSSTGSMSLLKVLLIRKLRDLDLGLSDEDLTALADKMFDDANEVSGDIALRAAKKGVFASELIGVVLSRFLLRSELGSEAPSGWYFLDDYAEWLGQKEEQIADILALSPSEEDGEPILRVLVSEAKYVDIAGLAENRKKSAKQLRDTMGRLEDALFGDPGRLDRDLWLARIADLILDGIEVPRTEVPKLSNWRRMIKEGRMKVLLRGYSHVFVPSAGDHASPREVGKVAKTETGFQEIFGREEVRELVRAYWNSSGDPAAIRRKLGDLKPWKQGGAKLPAGKEGGAPQGETEPAAPRPEEPESRSPESERVETETKPKDTVPTPDKGKAETPKEPPQPGPETPPADAVKDERWTSPKLAQIIASAPKLQGETDEAWLNKMVRDLQSALQSYSLQAKVLSKRLTPNAALVKFAGSDRLRVDDVERKRREFLTTHSLNIVSVAAEPGTVSISVGRADRQVVPLLSVWKGRTVKRDQGGMNVSLVAGVREDNGEILYLAPGLTHAPHTLIAGTTGSGKSVLMQNLILDIAATNPPELAKILLIDPKAGVDYFPFEGLPHLSHGIVIERDRALEALQQVVDEMDERYLKFRRLKVSKLAEYNAKAPPEERMPVRWIIHDEFAEWMMVEEYRDHVTQLVGRLGVKARAAGIFLLFAAQRPDANVMPMQLRDNLGNRLILRVESKGTSDICLGSSGAEHLLGKGHLAARLEGELGIVFAQVPLLGSDDVARVVETIGG